MDSAVIGAGAALMGSLVGALASFASSWVGQRIQNRRDSLNRKLDHREALYADFIQEAARLYSDSLTRTLEDMTGLIALYALVSRIRLFSSAPVVHAAEALVRRIVTQYGESNLSVEQIRVCELSSHEDCLKEFSLACRQELQDIQRGAPQRHNLKIIPKSKS